MTLSEDEKRFLSGFAFAVAQKQTADTKEFFEAYSRQFNIDPESIELLWNEAHKSPMPSPPPQRKYVNPHPLFDLGKPNEATEDDKPYWFTIEPGSISIIRCKVKDNVRIKPYEKNPAKDYWYIPNTDFLMYTGEKSVRPGEPNIAINFARGTMKAFRDAYQQNPTDGFQNYLIYRASERVSFVKVLTESEVDTGLKMKSRQIIKNHFPKEYALMMKRKKRKKKASSVPVQNESQT